MDSIKKLCAWYDNHCVDEWEEEFGIEISTLDNPGWKLVISLERTELQGRDFESIDISRTERDWIVARLNGENFESFGGPNNLDEMIELFLDWAERST